MSGCSVAAEAEIIDLLLGRYGHRDNTSRSPVATVKSRDKMLCGRVGNFFTYKKVNKVDSDSNQGCLNGTKLDQINTKMKET